jgi:5-methylcytosine-specific restriction endonuclease McrA
MKDNKEKILQYKKNYRKTERSKEYQREYQKSEKYKQNRKKYKEKNKEKLNNLNALWRKTDKGKASVIASSSKRRAIKKDGKVTSDQVLEIKKKAKVCYWCGRVLKGKKIHIDHYVPLSKGGEHAIENLVVSCSTCNLLKSSRDPLEFAQSIGKLF